MFSCAVSALNYDVLMIRCSRSGPGPPVHFVSWPLRLLQAVDSLKAASILAFATGFRPRVVRWNVPLCKNQLYGLWQPTKTNQNFLDNVDEKNMMSC